MSSVLELSKLHYHRKEGLAEQFGVTNKKIQEDTNKFIEYLIALNKTELTNEELLTFAESETETFYHQLVDWGDIPEDLTSMFSTVSEYRNAQMTLIISDISVLFNSDNKMIKIIPIS